MSDKSEYVPEYLVIATMQEKQLVAHGCVTRELAHSDYRIPHTTVLLVPYFVGSVDVLIHKRPQKGIGSGRWDFAGGHVSFEPGVLSGPKALLTCIEQAAVREAREEIWSTVNGKPHILSEHDVLRFTAPGELEADEPKNREFSTGFFVKLPATADVVLADQHMDGIVRPLETVRLSVGDLNQMFESDPNQFADGASRILRTTSLADLLANLNADQLGR